MSLLTDFITSTIGTHQSNKLYGKIANDYTGAENKSVNAFAPYLGIGTTGVDRLQQMSTPGFAYSPTDPSYAFTRDEAMRGVNRQYAATGALDSGGRDRAAMRYGAGLASQDFGNEFARNYQLAGLGMQGAQGTSNAYFRGADGRANAFAAQAGNDNAYWGRTGASFGNAERQVSNAFNFGG